MKEEASATNPMQRALAAALRRALRPFVRLFLRHGMPVQAMVEAAKRVFVEVAAEDFGLDGKRTTDLRVSVLTGLTRKEVRRLRQLGGADESMLSMQFNRAARVTTAWMREARYRASDGAPAALAFEGDGASFAELVRVHSGDMTPRAVLDELTRLGAVVVDTEGRLHLTARGYVPARDDVAKLDILGEDVEALAATIEHNLDPRSKEAWFQRKVTYDNLPAEALESLRQSAGRRGQALLERLDAEIAPHDRDVASERGGSGRKKILVGVYYWEGDAERDQSHEEDLEGEET